MSADDHTGMSFREILMEVREDVKSLFTMVDALDGSVVKKTELDLWRETQKNARRWAITTIISLLVLLVTITSVIIATR